MLFQVRRMSRPGVVEWRTESRKDAVAYSERRAGNTGFVFVVESVEQVHMTHGHYDEDEKEED